MRKNRPLLLLITTTILLSIAACGNSNAAKTMGQTLQADFKDRAEADDSITALDMADALLTNSVIEFSGATMEVEPGNLTGFSAEITGFKDGVMFAPMVGSIPFVGYIFTLDADGDVDAFMKTLTDNANPRWNVCTEADETIVDHVGNMVFFLMCPSGLEE